ncbi:MAG: 16S rRNA (adenine(1518)-N(6)/adenine(1519)-N(6))-dimethyltransferase RsmA [Verrucomicrobia bacterium]|nr:16S rRNA (adenine(1518)-N(6)/adenine(1519)-N(6))-dimethyltransferase RsmA [Verrucomicrobiota bacterium]MDA1340201.1 16S rRNA (adenine(1518)-N(6)/adenine(1519)-N(6))-dimethyltransferase RsmA [Verrucomicrobiota bacterium]
MATHGLRPLRQLGQNFLAEPALATVIAHALPKSTQEPVQEIGPGLGALTRALLTIGHTVEAFEIDQGLISWLRQSLQNEPRFQLIEGDALKTLPHHPPRSLVCGNLPYSISTPLLVQLALRSPPPATIVVTLQKEVADRYAALPRTSDYGAVSVLLQSVFQIEKIRQLPPEVFYPRPQVDSVVLRLNRHHETPTNLEPFYAFVKKGFSQRRKKLKSLLPVNLDRRAEELNPTEWRTLYESTRREI